MRGEKKENKKRKKDKKTDGIKKDHTKERRKINDYTHTEKDGC